MQKLGDKKRQTKRVRKQTEDMESNMPKPLAPKTQKSDSKVSFECFTMSYPEPGLSLQTNISL